MDEGQKKRHIGRGMKPRGNKAVKPQKEAKEMSDHSTTEGQQAPIVEAVLEPQEGNEKGGNLEAENSENSVQNLEKIEATVAQDEGLEAALNESGGEVIDAEFPEVDSVTIFRQLPDGKYVEVQNPDTAPLVLTAEEASKLGYEQPGGYALKVEDGNLKVFAPQPPLGGATFPILGLQPDGSTKVVVTIQEGYWEAVQQWAESDGVPVERWLSDRLYEYISTYGAPAQGR